MTDTRHEQPRCPICRALCHPEGCTPDRCHFRSRPGTHEHVAHTKRALAYDLLRAAGNPTPTLEDVDAELQPKGLPVLQWDARSPAWVGNWLAAPKREDTFIRALVAAPPHGNAAPNMLIATVFKMDAGRWTCATPVSATAVTFSDDHPTPEAAQAACEAAIIAAWRNR